LKKKGAGKKTHKPKPLKKKRVSGPSTGIGPPKRLVQKAKRKRRRGGGSRVIAPSSNRAASPY